MAPATPGVDMEILWPLLHQRMEEIGGEFWRVNGWVPIAFDGSRAANLADTVPPSMAIWTLHLPTSAAGKRAAFPVLSRQYLCVKQLENNKSPVCVILG